MMGLTVARAAAVLGADLTPAAAPGPGSGPVALSTTEVPIADVVVDSRAVGPGSLFVALAGARVDGHRFVDAAFAAGAVAAVTERPLPAAAGPCLVVADAVAALGRLARHEVDRASAGGLRVLGITGSQGKTSTKDLLAQILEQVAPTVAPFGNLNNELGVPLTATRIDAQTRFLVVEMGARGIGHIRYLCGITPPSVGVVLNVGQAHVGEFGSQQAIAVAKGELVEAVGPDGVAVLNADDPLVWGMRSRTAAPVCGFSVREEPTADRAVWASDIVGDELGRHRFVLHTRARGRYREETVSLRLSGRHHVPNALAAAAAATAVGVDAEQVAASLSAAQLRSRSRMELHERADGVVVINDAYNANPDSARAALDTLAEIGSARRTRQPTARTWAVLGDMLELGATAAGEHSALGRHLAGVGIDRLVAIGDFAGELASGAVAGGLRPEDVTAMATKSAAADRLLGLLRPGDTVLVKASRGLALDTVAEEIWTAAAPVPGPDASGSRQPRPAADREDPA